jgi:3-oxoadipate enol-lactonase/4-carboxymuconolactone decarboxylase
MFHPIRDLTAHIQVEGPPGAPAVLMLHSLGTNLHVWDDQAAALAASLRVIRFDMRGHGLTTVTPGPYRIDELAQDALAVLDAVGVEQAHVAGLSIGGLIAQAVAHLAPERVTSLVLCDTAQAIPPATMWNDRAATVRKSGMAAIVDPVMARWVTPAHLNTPAAQGMRTMLLATAPEGYAASAEAIGAWPGVSGLSVRTLVVVGAEDQSTSPEMARALAAAIPGAAVHIIADAAHISTMEQPEAVTQAMAGFLLAEPSPAGADPRYDAGLAVRRQVLGSAHVDRALANSTAFDRDFQAHITRTAWGGVWTRPGLDRRTRSLITLAVLASLGHEEEFKLHLRATRNTGAAPADISEMLLHISVYAGVPAANSAMRMAKEVLAAEPHS